MSDSEKTIWTVQLLGRFKRYGASIDVAARPGVSAGTIKALIANALRNQTGSEAVASLVGTSVLTTERGVLSDDSPPPEGSVLSILPPACG